jgi:hypothetical protein
MRFAAGRILSHCRSSRFNFFVSASRACLVELLGVGAVARSTAPLSLGERGGYTNRCRPRCLGKPVRSRRRTPSRRQPAPRECERACGAARYRGTGSRFAPWREYALGEHPKREITSRAVNSLKTTPGTGRTSRVSISTRSPGSDTACCLGLRTRTDGAVEHDAIRELRCAAVLPAGLAASHR